MAVFQMIQKLVGDIGQYPKEYNSKVHGPYDPSRYYGKPDTAFADVKISELPGWLARRRKNPRALVQAFSRGYWRWQMKYVQPKRSGVASYLQFVVGAMFFSTLT
uniref:ATP synthase subunit f, mitochondrial n=1 Tax=Strigamia maritima TaxID=126957 RepID=T1JMH3_STRMM